MKRLYKDEIQGTYFLGSLVTQSIPGSADGICPFLIIDGQQRLTTLTIILATLKEYLQKSKNQEDKELAAELYESYLVNKFKKGDDFYKILPTQDDREVYQTIKKKIDNPDCKTQDEIHNIIKFSKYYQCMVFEDIEEQDILKKYFKRFKKLAFSTCHIFLLNIYHEYHEKRLSLEQFKQILIYLESYFVRRWLVGISTKSLGKVFDNLYKEVKQENPDDLVEGLRRVLSNYDKTKNWPENDDFYQSFITQTVYKKSDTARVKLILES